MSDQDTFVNGIEIIATDLATSTSASLYTYGGISIFSTTDATDFDNGGSFLTKGGITICKSAIIGGTINIRNTIDSFNTSTGSLMVDGGLGVNKKSYLNDLYSNTISSGNIYAPTSTITNLVSSNISSNNLNIINGTIGNLNVNSSIINNLVVTNTSAQNLLAITSTISQGLFTNLTSTNLTATTVSSGSLSGLTSTIKNLVATNISSGTFSGVSSTIASGLFTNLTVTNLQTSTISTGNINAQNSTITNLVSTNVSTSTLSATTSLISNSTIIGTSHSYNSSTGSIILLNGGLSINDTCNSSSATFGGAFTVAGGSAFGSDIYAQGITYFKNTMNSISTTSGSVLVSGGLGVKANISGNAIILPSIIQPIYNNIVNKTSQFYIDTNDNLFKSVTTTSGTLTTYQPTNTNGDLLTHNGITQVRLPVGVNGQILTVNSNTVNGIQWSTGSNKSNQIYLVGNDNSTTCIIIQKSEGAFVDCVYPIIKYGASAIFFFTKSFSSQYGHIITNNGNRSSDNGILLAEYNPYQGIGLYKTTNGSNGLYIENSNQLFLGTTIQLISTNLTTTNFVSTYGAYFISISAQNKGPSATFIITKSDPSLNSCQITKISSSPGTNNCNLYINWYSLSPFGIYKTTNDNDDFYTIIDNFPNINAFTITLTGTNTVYLQKNMFNFYEKKSFFIKITYNSINGPCSIFSISKNYYNISGNKTTYQSPGKTTLEKIIFNWNSKSLPSISKTGLNYNGIYNVEISVF